VAGETREGTVYKRLMEKIAGEGDWVKGEQSEKRVVIHAIEHLVPRHLKRALGYLPIDVGSEGRRHDIESALPAENGKLRFVKGKGRKMGARDLTLTKNESHCSLNSRQQFILALVEIDGENASESRYVRGFPFRELWNAAKRVSK